MRTQAWWPDTHPGHELHTAWDGETFRGCTKAIVNGEAHPDPQAVYDLVLAENRLKNVALTAIRETLPNWIDPESVQWDFGAADGVVAFTVPGATDEVLTLLRSVVPEGATVG